MKRRVVNPWTWQDQFGYVQANEISGMERVLVCAGQTSVDADGQPLHEGDGVSRLALPPLLVEIEATAAK